MKQLLQSPPRDIMYVKTRGLLLSVVCGLETMGCRTVMGLQLAASTSALCAPAVEKKKTPAFQFRAMQKDNYYQLF